MQRAELLLRAAGRAVLQAVLQAVQRVQQVLRVQRELPQRVRVLLQVQELQELLQQVRVLLRVQVQRELQRVLPGELLSQMRIHNHRKKLRHPDFLFRN